MGSWAVSCLSSQNIDFICWQYVLFYASKMARRQKTDERIAVQMPPDERIVLKTIDGLPEIPLEVARKLTLGVTEPKKRAFVLALAQLGNRTRAARAIGISTVTVWQWRRDDDAFRAACVAAMECASELMEDELYRRACEGVLEPVFQGGELVGSVRRYSDTLLIFGLKGAMPEKYADRQKIQHEVDIVGRLRAGRERALGRAK